MLGGMNAATSRYIVSSTMAHLLICQGGTRFQFSHGFTDLLVGLEAALEGKPVEFRLQMNRHRKRRIVWKDSLADDYIHRPGSSEFKDLCPYQMAMKFKKKILLLSR